jgi:hypothetical protein
MILDGPDLRTPRHIHLYRTVLRVTRDRELGEALRRELEGEGCFVAGPFERRAQVLLCLEENSADLAVIDNLLARDEPLDLDAALAEAAVAQARFNGSDLDRLTLRVEDRSSGSR